VSLDVAALLYSVIDEIGKDKIRTDLNADILSSEKYCGDIMTLCKEKLGKGASDEALASACEALLHFMLTASLLPSQRKLAVKGVELDVVIPSVRTLLREPGNAIVIQIYRTDGDATRISNARLVQPEGKNIWVVSAGALSVGYRNYNLENDNSFSRIIVDIHEFVKSKGISGLKLLHGD